MKLDDPKPEVLEADLTPALLSELFIQLRDDSEIRSVRMQAERERLSGAEGHGNLAALEQRLRTGSLRGLQIRYRHGGVDWIDTLIRGSDSVRLIRTRAF